MPTIEELRKQYGVNPSLNETVATPSALEANQFADIDVKKAYQYGYDPTFKVDQEDSFAKAYQENTSWAERWGNRGKSLVAQTTLEALGGLTAIAYGSGSAIVNGDVTKVFDNDFSRMLDSYREDIQKNYQNYYTKEQQDSIAGWVSSGKFIDDLTGGASFLLGAALTEAAAGLLTAGTGGIAAPALAGNTARIAARAASLLKKADNAGDFGKLLSYADDATQITNRVNLFNKAGQSAKLGRQLVTGAGYEASVEALGAKKEYEAKIERQLANGEIDAEKAIELKQRADEAATASFFTNLALVGISNAVQFSSLFRPDILTTMSKVPSRYKMVDDVNSTYNKFRRGSRYVTNVGTEALEEFSQTVINKTGESYVFNKYDTDANATVLQTMSSYVKHAAEGVQNSMNQEGLQSAILGGVIGALGMPTFGLTRGADGKRQWFSGGISEARNENIEEVRRVNELQEKFNSNTKQGALQFISETMGSENTKANWVNGVQQHAATEVEEIALKSGNIMAAKNAEHDRLFSYVQNRLQVGQSNDITTMLDNVKQMTPEQFGEQFGYENLSKEELTKRKDETLAKAKERISNIESALKQVESTFPQNSEDWKTAAAYNLSKAKDVKSRLDTISSKLIDELQVTSMFEEESKKAQSQKESVQADYGSKIGKATSERDEILSQLKELPTGNTDKLVNRRDTLTTQIDSLTDSLNKDLRGIDAALEQVKKSSQLISKKGKKVEELDAIFMKNSDAIDNAIEQIAQDDPARASQLVKDFKDFKVLRDTHKRVIDEYNRLLTPQGTQSFEQKVQTVKKEGVSELPVQPEAETQNGEIVEVDNVSEDFNMDDAMDTTLEDPEKPVVKETPKVVEQPKIESNPPVVPAIAEIQPVGEVANELVVKDHYVYKENAEAYVEFTKLDSIDPSRYKIVPKTYRNNPGSKYGLDPNEVTYEVFYTLPNDLDVYVGFIEDARYDRLNGKLVTEDTVKEWSKTTNNPEYHEKRWRIKKELGSKIKSLNFKTYESQFAKITDPKNYEPLINYKYGNKTVVFYDKKFYEIDGSVSKRVDNAVQIGAYREALDARNVDNIRDKIVAEGDAVILTDKFLLPVTRKKAYNNNAAKESQDIILAEKYDSQGFIISDSKTAASLNLAIKLKIMLDVEQNASIKFDERKDVPGRYNLQFIVGGKKVFFSPANIEKHGLEELIKTQCTEWGINLIDIDNYVTSTPETTFTPDNWGGSKRIYRRVRLVADVPVIANTPAIINTPKVEVVEKQVESVPEKPVVTETNSKVDILKEVIESGKTVQEMIKDLESKGLAPDTKGAFVQLLSDKAIVRLVRANKEFAEAFKNYGGKPKIQSISNPTLLREDALQNLRGIIPSELISDDELNIAARNIQAVGDIEGLYDKFVYLAKVITPGTEYHEAFHAVFNALISPIEKRNLMNQWLMVNPKPSKVMLLRFKNSYSGYQGLNDAELLDEYIEESLADEFAKYMLNNSKPKALIGRIFDRIKRWLGLTSKIDQFFDLIKRGAFKNAPRIDEVNPVRVAKPNVLYADAGKQNPLETRTGHVVITRIAQRILSGQYSGQGISNEAKVEIAIKDTIKYYEDTYINNDEVFESLSQDTVDGVYSIINALENPENKDIIDRELELIKSLYNVDSDEEDEIEDLENRNSDEGLVTKPVNQQDGFSKENIWKLWTVNTFYTDQEFDGGPMVELPIDYYATQMHIKMLAKNYPKDKLWQVINKFALNPNEVELRALLKRLEATVRKELGDYKGDLTHEKMSDSFMYNAFILSNYKTDVEMFDLYWNPKAQTYEIGSANNSSIKRTTVNKWINNLATKPFTKTELVDAFNQIETMLETVGTTVSDIASSLNRVGIDVSYDYIKYNTYKLGLQNPIGEDLEWFKAIDSDEIPTLKELISPSDATETIEKMIKNSAIPTNVYADISGWLEKVAIGDSLFNTAVRKSTFKNVEGKTIYEIIYNSAESERMRAISNPQYRELVAEIKQNLKANPESLRQQTLKFMEFMNIPYQEYLTYQELVQWIADNPLVEVLSKVEPKFIGGYKDKNDNRKMFSEGDAEVKTNMLLNFATRGKKRKDTINYHLLNVKAGKTLQTIYGVKDQGFGTINSGQSLNDKTKEVLLDFFKQELNRIKRVSGFNNNPVVAGSPDFNGAYKEEIKAYTDSKRKRGGLAFMQHADFVKEILENPGYTSHKAFKDAGGVYETLPDTIEFYTNVTKDLESYWLVRSKQFVTDIAEEHKLKPDATETMDAYINDAIISRGLYQLLAYDPALTVKDAIDQNKRAGSDGAAGPSSSGRIRFATVSSIEYKLGNPDEDADFEQYNTVRKDIESKVASGKLSRVLADKALEKLNSLSESKTDTSDATSFMTTEAYIEHYLKPFLKYDNEVAEVYKKILAGIKLSTKDDKIIDSKNAHANPRKLVYSNGVDYIKTATNVLTRYEFSIAKNDNPEFLMSEYNKFIEAKNKYVKFLEDLERQLAYEEITQEVFDTKRLEEFGKYEQIVKTYQSNFIAIPGSEVGHQTLNRMQLYGLDMMAVDSASKKQKRKVGKLDTFNYHNTQVLDASYLREQVATDGVKIEVIDGTQKLSLIWSEQGSVEVLVDGIKVRVDTLSKAMQVQLGKRIVQGFQDLMPKIEKEGLAYYDYLKESLIASQQASGGNNYFIEFLQDDYNWNLPHIVGKVEASFFSATSKNTLKHKTSGTAVALLPGTMYNVLRDENNEVIPRNYVRKNWNKFMNDDGSLKEGYKTTRLRHLVWDESLGVYVSEAILPEIHDNFKGRISDASRYMVGIRIPTQDKQSMLAMKLVDTLPSYKGSLGIMPAESVKLSGEDFDIDKKFINYFATFKESNGKPVKYGNYLRTKNVEDAWYEYTKSKAGKDNLVTIPKAVEYFAVKEKIKKLKNEIKENPDDQDIQIDLRFAEDKLRELAAVHKQSIEDALAPIKEAFFTKYQVQIENNIEAFKKGNFKLITPITLEESNNLLLDIQLRMISNPDNLHIALTPAEMTPVEESIKLLTKFTDPKFSKATKDDLDKYVDSQGYVYVKGNHALDDKLKAFNNNDVGSKNIGVFALANTFYQYVMAEQIEPFYSTKFEIPNLGRINDIISAFLSSSTDNDKVQHAAVLGLDQESSGILGVSIMMGYNPVEIGIPMLNAENISKNIRKEIDDVDKSIIDSFKTVEDIQSAIKSYKDNGSISVGQYTLNEEFVYKLLTLESTSGMTQDVLSNIFAEVKEVSKAVSKVQRIMSLNKGFKPTIYDNLRVLQAVNDLKRLKDMGKEPFAAYDLVTTHPYLKANVQAAERFMKHKGVVSKFFLMATDKIRSGFDIVYTMSNEAAKEAMVKSISIEVMNSILNSDEDLSKLTTSQIIGEKGDFTIASHNLLKASKFGKMYMMKVLVPNRVTTDSGETYATMNLDTWAVSNKFTEEKLQSNFTFANGKPSKRELKNPSEYTQNLQSLLKRFKEIDSISDLEQRKNTLKQIVAEFESNSLELGDGTLVSIADILLNDYSKRLQAQAIVKDVMQFRNSSVVKLLNPKSWRKISSLFDTQQKAITKNETTVFDNKFVENALIHYAMSYENFTLIPLSKKYEDDGTKYSDYKVTIEDVTPLSKVAKFVFKDKKPIDAVPLQFVFRDAKGIKWIADEVTIHGQTYKSFDEVFKAFQEEGNEIQSVTYKPIDPDRTYWGNSEVLPHRHDKTKSLVSTQKKGKAAKSGVDNQVQEGQAPTEVTTQSMTQSVRFEEEPTTGYRNRTVKNASADATIAIAVDFNSAGEKLTKSTVLTQGKKYIPLDASSLVITQERVDKIVQMLNSVKAKTLNIAGNGIYTMKGKYTQQQVDDFTFELLDKVLNSPDLETKVVSIRSGGQTGFDEAGTKAGIKLGLPTLTLAPKGWTFRNIDGVDISNEQAFKARFSEVLKDISIAAPTVESKSIAQSIVDKTKAMFTEEEITEMVGSTDLPQELMEEITQEQWNNLTPDERTKIINCL